MNQQENKAPELSKMLEGLGSAIGVVDALKKQFEASVTQEALDALDPVSRAKMNGYISEIDSRSEEIQKIKPELDKAMQTLTNILTKQGT